MGKFKAPFGIERLQSATALTFVERALPTNLVPNRDLGYMLHGAFLEGAFTYQLAFMNGVTDGGSGDVDNADGKDFVARVFAEPFGEVGDTTLDWLAGLGVGLAASYGWQEPGTPSAYRTSGQATFFRYRSDVALEGHRMRWSPQLTYYWGPFGLMGEYVHTRTDVTRLDSSEQFDHTAWQVAASYVVTGENASYRGVAPASGFAPGKGWGAWEVAARYHELDVDGDAFDRGFADPQVSAESAQAWAVGVNWYPNRWVKVILNYERTSFAGGGGAADEDLDSESVLFVRTQLAF